MLDDRRCWLGAHWAHTALLLFGKASTGEKLSGPDPQRALTRDFAQSANYSSNTESSSPNVLIVAHNPRTPSSQSWTVEFAIFTCLAPSTFSSQAEGVKATLPNNKNYFYKLLGKANP